jgi:hypothetical protein
MNDKDLKKLFKAMGNKEPIHIQIRVDSQNVKIVACRLENFTEDEEITSMENPYKSDYLG